MATCAKEFGRLDVNVNNAGISVESTHVRPLRTHGTAEDGYDKIMAVNAKEAFLGCKPVCAQSISLAHAFFVAQSTAPRRVRWLECFINFPLSNKNTETSPKKGRADVAALPTGIDERCIYLDF